MFSEYAFFIFKSYGKTTNLLNCLLFITSFTTSCSVIILTPIF